MCDHQAREPALNCFQRKSTFLITEHWGWRKTVGEPCPWLATGPRHPVLTPMTLLALLSCPLIYFRLALCLRCKLWLVQRLLRGFLTPRKQQQEQHGGHLELVRNSGSQALTGQWNQHLHSTRFTRRVHAHSLLGRHFPPSYARDSCVSVTFSCTKQDPEGTYPLISAVHSFWPYPCLLFSNSNDF